MKNQLLSTEIVVAPLGAPRLVYSLSILRFETAGVPGASRSDATEPAAETGTSSAVSSIQSIYMHLQLGREIELTSHVIHPYDREIPNLLLTDRPLLLTESGPNRWHLSMPAT